MEFVSGQVYKLKEDCRFVLCDNGTKEDVLLIEKETLLTFISVVVKRSVRDNTKYVYDSRETHDYPHQYFIHVTVTD